MAIIEQIEDYLERFASSLQRISDEDRANILAEIRSHLFERAARGEAAAASTLAELGEPHELAQVYLQELKLSAALDRRTPLQLLLVLLQLAKRNTRAAIFAGIACFFYFIAIAFSVIAMIKPFVPQGLPGFVGKFGLGGMARTAHTMDILGWALVPIGAALAVTCYLYGTALLRVAARRALSSARV